MGKQHVGTTARRAYAKVLAEAERRADALNNAPTVEAGDELLEAGDDQRDEGHRSPPRLCLRSPASRARKQPPVSSGEKFLKATSAALQHPVSPLWAVYCQRTVCWV